MSIDKDYIKKREEASKEALEEKILILVTKSSQEILRIQQIEATIGIHTPDMPRISENLNSKIKAISTEFKNAGISFYVTPVEDKGYVATNFIGQAIISDLVSLVSSGIEALYGYEKAIKQISDKNNNGKSSNVSKKNIFSSLKNIFKIKKTNNYIASEDDLKEADVFLRRYEEFSNLVMNYNLRENVVKSIVRQIINKKYGTLNIPSLLNQYIKPDLEALGLADLLPSLHGELVMAYSNEFENPNKLAKDQSVPYYTKKKMQDKFDSQLLSEDKPTESAEPKRHL